MKQENYDEQGYASHYNEDRLNSMVKFERTYGTLAVMTFCEITAEKYRSRISKKDDVNLEIKKMNWYLKAAKFYFEKLGSKNEIFVNNYLKESYPWKK